MPENNITPIELVGIVESYISYLYNQPGMMTGELSDVEESLKDFADDIEKVKNMLSEEEYTRVMNDINGALKTLGFEPIQRMYR